VAVPCVAESSCFYMSKNLRRQGRSHLSSSVFSDSSLLTYKFQLSQRMLAVPSWNAASNDSSIQNIARRKRTIKGIRLLRRKINHLIHTERENAIIYRLLARRFPSDSNEGSSLRLLGRRAMRRVQRLKGPLAELGEIWSPPPRTRRFYARYLGMLYAPRRWLYCRLKMKTKTQLVNIT
jgi:hypothetical protein